MLVEISIYPLGAGTHIDKELAEVVKLVDNSGLAYQLTPSGTIVEGEWNDVMALVHRCHLQARTNSEHVVTHLKIEDHAGQTNQLNRNVDSVNQQTNARLRTEP